MLKLLHRFRPFADPALCPYGESCSKHGDQHVAAVPQVSTVTGPPTAAPAAPLQPPTLQLFPSHLSQDSPARDTTPTFVFPKPSDRVVDYPSSLLPLPQQRELLMANLSEALLPFSLDIVKLVFGYAFVPAATAGAKPKLLMEVRNKGRGFELVRESYGIAVSPDNRIWVGNVSQVVVFDENGEFHHHAPGSYQDSCGIAFDAKGHAYIVDHLATRIVVCGLECGDAWSTFGERGPGERQFFNPYYNVIDPKQELMFVVDAGNVRVLVLKLDGTFVRQFEGAGVFGCPLGIAIRPDVGEIAVSCRETGKLQIFDYNGKLLRKCETIRGTLQGVAADSAGNWLVCDSSKHRVQVFRSDGSFLTEFGEFGKGPGQLSTPYGVCVDPCGRILVVDNASHVQVFGFS